MANTKEDHEANQSLLPGTNDAPASLVAGGVSICFRRGYSRAPGSLQPEQIQEFTVCHTCFCLLAPRRKSKRPASQTPDKVTELTKVYFLAQTMHLLRWWRMGFRFASAEEIQEPLVHCNRSKSKSSSFGTPFFLSSAPEANQRALHGKHQRRSRSKPKSTSWHTRCACFVGG